MEIKRILSFEYRQPEAYFLFSGSCHSHWALCYGISGSVHAVIEGRHLALSPGQMVLCAPDQFHMLYAQEGPAPSFAFAVFDATDLPQAIAGTLWREESLHPALNAMVKECNQPDGYSENVIRSLLNLVLVQLCRRSIHLPEAQTTQQGEYQIIRRAQQHISAHIQEKLSVTLVAGRIDVSPSYMTALFHKHLAISPGEYIRRAKLQESKRLIAEGVLNFTEIAATLEYSTVHHFSRQFKEHFGMTPTQYARQAGTKGS